MEGLLLFLTSVAPIKHSEKMVLLGKGYCATWKYPFEVTPCLTEREAIAGIRDTFHLPLEIGNSLPWNK